jgi:hypothetical protein
VKQGVRGGYMGKGKNKGKKKPVKLAEEIRTIEYEPLLPIEKKLIGRSLAIGIILLNILIWVF